MGWYSIRTVYAIGTKSDGTNVFEERAVAFEAPDWDQAHAKARVESDSYATQGFEVHPEQVGYELDDTPLVDGYELWSQLFESNLELPDFYQTRYAAYEYHPE